MSRRARFRERLENARRVHVDARVLAYHLVGDGTYRELTTLLLGGVQGGEVTAQSSAISLYQVLAEPYREGMDEAAGRAGRQLSAFPDLELVPVDAGIAAQAAEVRARLGGRLERALQIATALTREADLYLTERSGLRRIAGMSVLNLEDFLPADGG